MRINFEQVSRWGRKVGKCGCGKRRTRTTTITHTINPHNTNADGVPKSREEVLVDVERELAEWKAETIYCDNCKPKTF